MYALRRLAVALSAVGVLSLLIGAARAADDDAYYCVSVGKLELIEGALPKAVDNPDWRNYYLRGQSLQAYAVIDGEGEAYLRYDAPTPWRTIGPGEAEAERDHLAVRAPRGRDITGKLYLPKGDLSGMTAVKFRLPASAADADAKNRFLRIKADHYARLVGAGSPGGAWFRHQLRETRRALGERDPNEPRGVPWRGRPMLFDSPDATFELFTGGRAISENLQLDRALMSGPTNEQTVPIDSIEGITVREIDWKPLLADKKPKLDPLAASVPADQHVVFFPTFRSALAMSDETAEAGDLIFQLAEPRSTDAKVLERYQRQLCLSVSGLARVLGPKVAKSVALTGSDPYFLTGTDVAVLFESPEPAVLKQLIFAQATMKVQGVEGAKAVSGEAAGVAYKGYRSADRRVCSLIAQVGDAVVVTNSPAQLERLALVAQGKSPSIALLDEYHFFRDRYPLGDSDETAFLFLSDATIRRWCGPRWRIANSRRTRDAAVLAELQAAHLDRLVAGKAAPGPIYTDLPTSFAGELQLQPAGVTSSDLGALDFLTPLAEIPLDRVTKTEAEAYRRWREGYQSNWQWAFDPIGLRLEIGKKRLAADLTVMPLIAGSQYRELIAVSQGARLAPNAGDPHDTLVHFILAINKDSNPMREAANFARMMAQGVRVDPLSWLGDNIGLYVEDDPLWDEVAKLDPNERDRFVEKNLHRLPVAFRAEVSSGLKLTAFLAAFRAFVDQTAPGMTAWESLTYRDQPYVKITPTPRAARETEELRNLALYYVASGESLLVTLSEPLLKRAIDRQIARDEAKTKGETPPAVERPWLGESVGLQARQKILRIAAALTRREYQAMMQQRAWSNLPILNEWKRRYPDQDPLAVHAKFWHEELICPGGGKYVWNPQWQTMESTVYGHPGEPKDGPTAPPLLEQVQVGNFGLSFEEQGLRARVVLER